MNERSGDRFHQPVFLVAGQVFSESVRFIPGATPGTQIGTKGKASQQLASIVFCEPSQLGTIEVN